MATRAGRLLWSYASDGDGVAHLRRTDGWAEQSLVGDGEVSPPVLAPPPGHDPW